MWLAHTMRGQREEDSQDSFWQIQRRLPRNANPNSRNKKGKSCRSADELWSILELGCASQSAVSFGWLAWWRDGGKQRMTSRRRACEGAL
jgi:hypothetical protein